MARTLAAWVHLPGPDGATASLGPGTVPPEWAAEQITNPRAWAPAAAVDAHEAEQETGVEPGGDDPAGVPGERPKGNASKAEWATYAAALGVEIEDDWKVADIRAAVDAHEAE